MIKLNAVKFELNLNQKECGIFLFETQIKEIKTAVIFCITCNRTACIVNTLLGNPARKKPLVERGYNQEILLE